jgi:hypothetical protein
VTPGGRLVPVVGGDPGGGDEAQDAEQVLLHPGGLDQVDRPAGVLLRAGPVVQIRGE